MLRACALRGARLGMLLQVQLCGVACLRDKDAAAAAKWVWFD
jgi:hypothetical protein